MSKYSERYKELVHKLEDLEAIVDDPEVLEDQFTEVVEESNPFATPK